MLRPFIEEDADTLRHWYQPEHLWHRFNGPYYPPPSSEEVEKMIGRWVGSTRDAALRRVLAIADAESDALLGVVTRHWISEETDWPSIGLAIYDPENWSKGLGYEALGLWCDYLFKTEPKFRRLDMRTWSGNDGMKKLAAKLGFKEEAVFRDARIVDGEVYDGLGFGILRHEWEHQFPNGFP